MNNINIIASPKNWIEGRAKEQLEHAAGMSGVVRAVGLPDLHPGKGIPVGAALVTEGVIYPHVIGNDIGCGMSLFRSGVALKKVKVERLVKRLEGDEELRRVDPPDVVEERRFEPTDFDHKLGTIGGGNHFAELQSVAKVYDSEAADELGLDKKEALLLVHSGSRGYGNFILDRSIREFTAQNGLAEGSEGALDYIKMHDNALNWASYNRELVAGRLLEACGFSGSAEKLVDLPHNFLEKREIDGRASFIHRKGAAPADRGVVVIPGSRGAFSYLVMPAEDCSSSAFSLAHGAGRKWERSSCKGKLVNRYTKESIKTTALGGRVVCRDKSLLYEEAAEAYKSISVVISDLVEAGLIKVIAELKPLLTYKI